MTSRNRGAPSAMESNGKSHLRGDPRGDGMSPADELRSRDRRQHALAEAGLEATLRRWDVRLQVPELRFLLAWLRAKERVFPTGTRRRWRVDKALSSLLALLAPRSMRDRDGGTVHQCIDPAYAVFAERHEPARFSENELEALRDSGSAVVSFVTVAGGASLAVLQQTAESLHGQTWTGWTWHILDTQGREDYFEEQARKDPRLDIVPKGSAGGDVEDLRLVLGRATGDLVVLLEPGTALAPWAAYGLARAAQEHPEASWFYADFDHLDELGYRTDPVFLPDWSPEMMLSRNLLEGANAIRTSLLSELDFHGVGRGFGAWWDLALRAMRSGVRFCHVPGVLVHRPVHACHREGGDRFLTHREGEEAVVLTDHLEALGLRSVSVKFQEHRAARCSWAIDPSLRISILIPSRDQAPALEACLQSLFRHTRSPAFDVRIVDTGSEQPATRQLYARFGNDPRFSVSAFSGPFNFAAACNFGARETSGELILFLNNDTEALEPGWLEAMAQWFELDGVGAVGSLLLYPDGRVQHAGVVMGMGALASHLFQGFPEDTAGMFGPPGQVRNVSAVTAACMLVSRRAFEAVGGFDEGFVLNYSDVDLCLRLRHAGYRIVYEPQARLVHHESLTHRRRIPRRDFELASERWTASGDLDGDPYFNPNLSYMSALPIFNRGPHDNPRSLNRRLMKRMPRKEILTLPDDLR